MAGSDDGRARLAARAPPPRPAARPAEVVGARPGGAATSRQAETAADVQLCVASVERLSTHH